MLFEKFFIIVRKLITITLFPIINNIHILSVNNFWKRNSWRERERERIGAAKVRLEFEKAARKNVKGAATTGTRSTHASSSKVSSRYPSTRSSVPLEPIPHSRIYIASIFSRSSRAASSAALVPTLLFIFPTSRRFPRPSTDGSLRRRLLVSTISHTRTMLLDYMPTNKRTR